MRASLIGLLICLLPLPMMAQLFHRNDNSDSIKFQSTWLNANACASFIGQYNWSQQTNNAISLLGSLNYRHRLKRCSGFRHEHSFRSEVGFLSYIDSSWIKSSDFFRGSLSWIKAPGKKLTQTYAVYFSTQWLNSWSVKEWQDDHKNTWSGGFLNPATIEFSYGLNLDFLKSSRLVLALATIRISSRPRFPSNPDLENEKDKTLFITPHSYIRSIYGFSAQLNLFEEFCNKVVFLENDSRLFFNALNREGIHLDISNRVAIRFLKFLQLRFDTSILYDPDYSMKFQYRQEVLLGVFYEYRK